MSLSDYLDNLQTSGQYYFLRSNAIESLGLSASAFKQAVYRLSHKGRIIRIRRDFYTLVPLEYKETGCLPAPWFIDDLMKYLSAQYYVSLLSAAAVHGASHQQPMLFQVIADQVILPIKIGRLRINFYYKKKIDSNFSKSIKTETGLMQVATPEMTACDLVRYMNAAGQINNITTILCELQPKILVDTLLSYVGSNSIEVSIVQRLGFLLEHLIPNLQLKQLAEWVKREQPHYRLLVTGHQNPIVERNKRWRILVNEIVETDL